MEETLIFYALLWFIITYILHFMQAKKNEMIFDGFS